jgi:hypothetical protein
MPEMNRFSISLHRDEAEDLIDYGDSDAEDETAETTAIVAMEEVDIFADDSAQAETPGPLSQPDDTNDNFEEPTEEPTGTPKEDAGGTAAQSTAPPTSTTLATTTKTTEAATVIKNLNELLTNADFRAALG